MKALKFTNVAIALLLFFAGILWVIKGQGNLGGLSALLLPISAFLAAFIALQKPSKRLLSIAWWLNSTLIAIFLLIDLLALFVYKVQNINPVMATVFQILIVFGPAVANLAFLRHQRRILQ